MPNANADSRNLHAARPRCLPGRGGGEDRVRFSFTDPGPAFRRHNAGNPVHVTMPAGSLRSVSSQRPDRRYRTSLNRPKLTLSLAMTMVEYSLRAIPNVSRTRMNHPWQQTHFALVSSAPAPTRGRGTFLAYACRTASRLSASPTVARRRAKGGEGTGHPEGL